MKWLRSLYYALRRDDPEPLLEDDPLEGYAYVNQVVTRTGHAFVGYTSEPFVISGVKKPDRPSRIIGQNSVTEEERARRNAVWRVNNLPDECLFR